MDVTFAMLSDDLEKRGYRKSDTCQDLLTAPAGRTAFEIYSDIMETRASWQKWEEDMLTACADQVPILEFLERAAVKLANPLALMDTNMTILARGGKFVGSTRGTIWEKMNGKELDLYDFYSPEEQKVLSEQMKHAPDHVYIYQPEKDREHTYYSQLVSLENEIFCTIGSVDINAAFSQGQQDALKTVGKNITRYIRCSRQQFEIFGENESPYEILLKTGETDERRLREFGWKPEGRFTILSFVSPISFYTPLELVSAEKRISLHFPKAMNASFEKRLSVLIRNEDYDLYDQHAQRNLTEFLKESDMHGGMSCSFSSFADAVHYYPQSVYAADQAVQRDARVIRYPDVEPDHLYEVLAERTDLLVFCRPEVIDLTRSSKENDRILVPCLKTYLLCGQNIAETARKLNIHRNTLIYRLKKLEEKLGVEFEEMTENECEMLLTSCRVVECIKNSVE